MKLSLLLGETGKSFLNTNKEILSTLSGYKIVEGVTDRFTPQISSETSLNETARRLEEAQSTEYLNNGFMKNRAELERTQDKINILNSLKKSAVKDDEHYLELLSQGMEETEAFSQTKTKYDEELEMLYELKKIQEATTQYARENLGIINRTFAAPAYDVLIDAMNITDAGDLVSGGRLIATAASGLISGGVGTGLSKLGVVSNLTEKGTKAAMLASNVITKAGVEAATSIPDTYLDIKRMETEGQEYDWGTIAKQYGLNFAGGMAMEGVTSLASYGFGKMLNKFSQDFNTKAGSTLAESKPIKKQVGKNQQYAEVGLEADNNLTTANAYHQNVVNHHGQLNGEIKADIDIPSGEIEKVDPLAVGPDKFNNTLKVDVDMNTSGERRIMAKVVEEAKNKNPKDELDTKKLLEENKLEIKRLEKEKKVRQIDDFTRAMIFDARHTVTEAQKIALEKGENVNKFIGDNTLATYEKLYSITNILDTSRLNQQKTFNFGISKRGAKLKINDYSDFVRYSNENGIDVGRFIFTGRIGKEMPNEYKEVAGYVKEMADKYVFNNKPLITFEDTDSMVSYAYSKGLHDLFEAVDFASEGNSITLRINPDLDSKELTKIVRTLKDEARPNLEKNLDVEQVFNATMKKTGLLPDVAKSILNENIVEDGIYIKRLLREAGLTDYQARTLFNEFNRARKKIEPDNAMMLLNTINSDISQRNSMSNKVWKYINKQQALANESLFRVETGTRSKWITEEEARKILPKEQIDKLDKILEKSDEFFGTYDPQLATSYYGFNIQQKSGKTVTKDIRTTDVTDVMDQFLESQGVTKKFENLTPEQKIKAVDSLMAKFQLEDDMKVGTNVARLHNPKSLSDYFETFIKQNNLPRDMMEIEINTNAPKFEAYFQPSKTNKQKIVLNFPKGMDQRLQLGVLRHELEHAKEFFEDGLENINFKGFRNMPTVSGSGAFQKLIDGKPVSIREMLAAYYNKHFYNVQNDTFERNLLNITMRDRLGNMSKYDRMQNFMKMLRNTRIGAINNRATNKELFGFMADEIDMPDIIDSNYFQDFITKTFHSPEKMYDFFDFLSDFGTNKAERNSTVFWQTIAGMTTKDVGFSPATLLNSLNDSRMDKYIKENLKDIDNEFVNTNMRSIIGGLRNQLRDSLIQSGSRKIVPNDFKSLLESGVVSAMIGARPVKEAIVTPTMAMISYAFSGGDIKGLKKMSKNWVIGLGEYAKSYGTVLGTGLENTGEFVNWGLRKTLGVELENNFLCTFGDTLRKTFKNKGITLDTHEAKILSKMNTDLRILSADGDVRSFSSFLARALNGNLVGNSADDLILERIAHSNALFELNGMAKANSYESLSAIQKSMYNVSGFEKEQFELFKQNLIKVRDTSDSFLDLKSEHLNVKLMLGIAQSKVDVVGLGRKAFKTTDDTGRFFFMAKTVAGAALIAGKRMHSTNVNGVEIPMLSGAKFGKAVGLSLLAIAGSVPAQYAVSMAQEYLLGYKNNLEELRQDLVNITETKNYSKLAKDFTNYALEMSPMAYYKAGNTYGGGLLDNLGAIGEVPNMLDQNIFDFSNGEFRSPYRMLGLAGSTIAGSTFLRTLKRFEKDKKATSRTFRSKKFRNEFEKELEKDFEKYLTNSGIKYIDEMDKQYRAMQLTNQY